MLKKKKKIKQFGKELLLTEKTTVNVHLIRVIYLFSTYHTSVGKTLSCCIAVPASTK